MGEDKKLTGREAVIALMQGKKIRAPNAQPYFYLNNDNVLIRQLPNEPFENCHDLGYGFDSLLRHDYWELVSEPMVYESETVVGGEYDFEVSVQVPKKFNGKRVKVRVEEIL